MSDTRHGNVRWKGYDYGVTWHYITYETYVYWGSWRYAGKAYSMQEALDVALAWLNNHAH